MDLAEALPTSPIYYTEDAHPPVFHSFSSVPASNGRASMVPMAVFETEGDGDGDDGEGDEEETLFDSTAILKRACPFLYPTDLEREIEDFENDLDASLGPCGRTLVLNALTTPELHRNFAECATAHTSKIETILFRRLAGNILPSIQKSNVADDDAAAERCRDEVRSVFDRVSRRLEEEEEEGNGDGRRRRYLFRDAFTAADLTFAALAGPLLMPKELLPLQLRKPVPPRLSSLREELVDTPAGRHAASVYHNHRFGAGTAPRAPSKCSPSLGLHFVVPKSAGRNRVPPWATATAGMGALVAVAVAGASAPLLWLA